MIQTLREGWAAAEPQPGHGSSSYMAQLRARLNWAHTQAQELLQQIQKDQKRLYVQTAQQWQLQVRDQVLVHSRLFPKMSSQEWTGPFPILRVCGFLIYEVRCGPHRRDIKKLHVNHLKRSYEPDPEIQTVMWSDQ